MTDHGQQHDGDYDVWGADFGKVGIDGVTDNRVRPGRRTPEQHDGETLRAAQETAAIGALEYAEAILVAHQRHRGGCLCGWAELGKSLPGHQVAMLRDALDQAEARGYATAVAELRGVVQRTGSPAAQWAAEYLEAVGPGTDETVREVVHRCPLPGAGTTPCCGRTPFELDVTSRLTEDDALVTCSRPLSATQSAQDDGGHFCAADCDCKPEAERG